MALNTVIFDIDGLLIDSEPLWNEAASEVFQQYGVTLTQAQYQTTTGLRTKEFIQWWFVYFNLPNEAAQQAEKMIIDRVLIKIKNNGKIMPGVPYIFDLFRKKSFKIGLATSSPPALIDLVVEMAGIEKYVQTCVSAENLIYGKPHPQVYLNCAELLHSKPVECICFEDSFNGLLAAKSARMKCILVPHISQRKDQRWGAADLQLSSLQNFTELHFKILDA